MNISLFLTFHGPEEQRDAMGPWFESNLLPPLQARPEVAVIEVFRAEKASDPHLDDGPGPLLLVQLTFDSVAGAEAAFADAGVLDALGDPNDLKVTGCRVDYGLFENVYEPVRGEVSPREAPFTYVVRYYRPAEDEKYFQEYYVAHHPPILAEMPNIRNVRCYLPVTWNNPTAMSDDDCMLGNEVVFDAMEDLNEALKSDVRHKLREDFFTFPPYSGPVTHFGMQRKRV
jgi:uncharacterized protein (TIGR02118 family)